MERGGGCLRAHRDEEGALSEEHRRMWRGLEIMGYGGKDRREGKG